MTTLWALGWAVACNATCTYLLICANTGNLKLAHHVRSFVFGGMVFWIAGIHAFGDSYATRINLWLLFSAFLTYVNISFIFYNIYAAQLASLHINILKVIYRNPLRILEKHYLLEKYPPEKVIEKRLARLIKSGQIKTENQHFFLARNYLVALGSIFAGMKKVLGR
jgi:hypothetical protein